MIRLNVLFPLRSYQSSHLHFEHFHTSILSFLFSIVINNSHENHILQNNLFPSNYFQELAIDIENSFENDKPNEKVRDQCIERYIQILSICKTSSLPLIQLSMCDLGKHSSFITHHKLFQILEHKEGQEIK